MFALEKNWQKLLEEEMKKEYFLSLEKLLKIKYTSGNVYPAQNKVFEALNLVSFEEVRVVIIGQDPYHNQNQAHGLSFSVEKGVKVPPSLKNIFKELASDLNCHIPKHGNLTKWAKQGVLLLNTTLTVEHNKPNSHKDLGWQNFTKSIVQLLNKRHTPVVFLLWGSHAIELCSLIDDTKHFVLTAAHPSPFSAYNGFFGSKHFSKTNEILKQIGSTPIDWQIEEI